MSKYFFILLVFIALGCKKNPFDYRTKYLGTYNFTINVKSFYFPNTNRDTSYITTGYIEYGKEKNEISVCFPNQNNCQTLITYEDGTVKNNNCIGEMETHKINYTCTWSSSSALIVQNIVGEKK